MSDGSQVRVPAPSLDRTAQTERESERTSRDRPASAWHARAWSTVSPPAPVEPPAAGHALSRIAVLSGALQQIMPRLLVGKPNDRYEEEADRAADRAVTAGGPAQVGGLAAEHTAPLRRRSLGEDEPSPPLEARAPPDLDRLVSSAGAEGRPLPADQRAHYRERMGHDFGAVRIHAGPRAARAAAALGAQAFTRGQDVYFGAGHYRPQTGAGRWLVAHELAHTVQQRPNVIARQPLAAPAEVDVEEPATSERTGSPSSPLPTRCWASCAPPRPAQTGWRKSGECRPWVAAGPGHLSTELEIP